MKRYSFKAKIEAADNGGAYVLWISEAKKEETRSARLTKAIEMLKKGIKTPG
jgi:uncharacterized protein YdeI (YjbR/CyaY-like superfamily)